MTLSEIENLPHAELKARRDELTEAAKAADPAELAARYVQARTDAKARDEKLAEQGKTIVLLQQSADALTERLNAAESAVAREKAAGDKMSRQLAEQEAVMANCGEQLAAETRRANEAEGLAKARRAVLAELMSKVAPLLAAE